MAIINGTIVCKLLSCFRVLTVSLCPEPAIFSNSRCLSSSAEFLALIIALAVAPPADANAKIPAAIAPIKGINGIIPPLRSIVFVKVEPSSDSRISFGSNFTCSRFKNLVLNLLHIKHSFHMKSTNYIFFDNNRFYRLCIIFTF